MPTQNLERAIGVAKGVLGGVKADQLDDQSPCQSWKVKDVINHLVGGGHFFASATEAGEFVDAGGDAPDFSASDYLAGYDEASGLAVKAFQADGAQEKIVKLPFGEFPGSAFMGLATMDTFTHAWDIAKATGQSTDLDPELAEQLLTMATAMVPDQFRGPEPMPFGPQQEVPAGASTADKLAAFLGRKV